MFKVVEPPRDTAPPPVKPVPAVTVNEELANAELAIDPAGRETEPDETVNPVILVSAPALVSLAVPPVLNSPSTRFKDRLPVDALSSAKTSAVDELR
jgi:hypothetical protein